jgi:small subunit ribosomal protein S17
MDQKSKSKRHRATRIGRVVSNAMEQSVVVSVERLVTHRLYRKTLRRSTRFMAHDAENECQVGDKVLIEETKPMSKRKCWVLKEVLQKAKV